MEFSSLPNEIILLVAETIVPLRDLNSLGRVNHYFHNLLTTPLYRRALTDDSGAVFKLGILWGHSGLIRRLINEANQIHRWSWAIFQANWDRPEPQGLVRYLVAKERNVDITQEGQSYGQDIIHSVIQDIDPVSLEIILENDGDKLGPQATAQQIPHIFQAAKYGNSAMVRTLLKHNFPVDCAGDDSRTALMHAAIKCNNDMVVDLLDAGASVHATDVTFGFTALGWAVMGRAESDFIRLLIQRGSDPNLCTERYDTLFHMAIRTRALDSIQPFLEAGVDHPDPDDCDFLVADMYIQGRVDLIDWLAEHFPTIVDRTNRPMPWVLLDRAVRDIGSWSRVSLIRTLRDWNVDLNVLGGDYNETILMSALRSRWGRFKEKIEVLLQYGADPNLRGTYATPIELAMSVDDGNQLSLVKLLVRYGMDLDRCEVADRARVMRRALMEEDRTLVEQLRALQ